MDPDSIPFEINFVTFDLAQIPSEITKSEELRKYVLLQTQGESVTLIESPKSVLSMYIFSILHNVCPAVTFQSSLGKKYSIYDHNNEMAIRPNDVDYSFSVNEDFNVTEYYPQEVTIDIENLWRNLVQDTEETKIKGLLENLKEKIHRTNKTTLIGKVPVLALLCAQHLIGNNTKQLYYKSSFGSEAKRVK